MKRVKRFCNKMEKAQQKRRHKAKPQVSVLLAPAGDSKHHTWWQTAEKTQAADIRCLADRHILPPCYLGVEDPKNLAVIGEFHDFLDQYVWSTCPTCWRAWYEPCGEHSFSQSVGTGRPWFRPGKSNILGKWCFQGSEGTVADTNLLALNPDVLECKCGATGLEACPDGLVSMDRECCKCHQKQWQRMPRQCLDCCEASTYDRHITRRADYALDPVYVVDEDSSKRCVETWQLRMDPSLHEDANNPAVTRVLGLPLSLAAPPLAALSDFEEMLLSLVHPLVQVYTIPTTGEYAYVGHVCNFRQDVHKFMTTLPLPPEEAPFVFVRPRTSKAAKDQKPRKPVKVDVSKLKAAFQWLKAHNPYYRNVGWCDEQAAKWDLDDVALPTRYEDVDAHQQVSQAILEKWLLEAHQQPDAFPMGNSLLAVFAALDETASRWFQMLDGFSEIAGKSCMRVAETLSTAQIAQVMSHHGLLPEHLKDEDIAALPPAEWPAALTDTIAEIVAVKVMLPAAEDHVEITATSEQLPEGDDEDRRHAVEQLAKGEATSATSEASALDGGDRVDAPDVAENAPVPENTPGYIAMAFPKIFPFGCGDYHECKQPLEGPYKFADWGKHVMQWHDGRAMRHTRFRYWLLNTVLRLKTPGTRSVFYQTNAAAADLTLSDLQDPAKRRQIVQKMTTSSAQLPGSVGERRSMRQDLEALVDQKEVETALLSEQGGRGRLPAGFATFTTAPYKWAHLHDMILRSYSPQERRGMEEWKEIADAEERNAAQRKAYYKLAQSNPGVVAWYSAMRLEATVHMAVELLSNQAMSEQVPSKKEAMAAVQRELANELGDDSMLFQELLLDRDWGRVDDWWACYEWSGGGLIHVHVCFWIKGSPRIDKVKTGAATGAVEETLWTEDGQVELSGDAAAKTMNSFFERLYTEWNLQKPEADDARRISKRRQMSKQELRQHISPDMISVAAHRELLRGGDAPEGLVEDDEAVWEELANLLSPDEWQHLSAEHRRQAARLSFITTLAEWSQMHDLHEPFPMGPPSKTQSCAKVDCEFTSQETTSCGKLFPRKLISPGAAEVAEDPRRRELFRLWMGRNCHFINNYVPVLMLATQSNMDFQAVTSKYGVVEYLTKYLTKSGQGSLIGIMEKAFDRCMSKAQEEGKGAKSAIAKFFNLAATQEVKTQGETMHLLFDLPRHLSSRSSFKRLSTRSLARKLKTADQVDEKDKKILYASPAEVYFNRVSKFKLPPESSLLEVHPSRENPLWVDVLTHYRTLKELPLQSYEGHVPDDFMEDLVPAWEAYLKHCSWWEFARLFSPRGNALRVKPESDVIIVSPMPRLSRHAEGEALVRA